MGVSSTVACHLLTSGWSVVATEIVAEDAARCPILVVRDSVRHYVFVGGVAPVLVAFSMSRVGQRALPWDLPLRGLIVFANAAHLQSVLHGI